MNALIDKLPKQWAEGYRAGRSKEMRYEDNPYIRLGPTAYHALWSHGFLQGRDSIGLSRDGCSDNNVD